MKKIILALAASGLLLTGCGSKDPEASEASRASIPADSVIQMNMEALGYTVTLNDMTEQSGMSMLAAKHRRTALRGSMSSAQIIRIHWNHTRRHSSLTSRSTTSATSSTPMMPYTAISWSAAPKKR